jgi:hypothetical protein
MEMEPLSTIAKEIMFRVDLTKGRHTEKATEPVRKSAIRRLSTRAGRACLTNAL